MVAHPPADEAQGALLEGRPEQRRRCRVLRGHAALPLNAAFQGVIHAELYVLLNALTVDVQVATEVSPGDRKTVAIAPLADIAQLTTKILKAVQ